MGNFDNIPAIQQTTVLEVTWTNCPDSIKDEIRQMWADNELRNDVCYYYWNTSEEENDDPEDRQSLKYPKTHQYLLSHGVTKCLIHYWW